MAFMAAWRRYCSSMDAALALHFYVGSPQLKSGLVSYMTLASGFSRRLLCEIQGIAHKVGGSYRIVLVQYASPRRRPSIQAVVCR